MVVVVVAWYVEVVRISKTWSSAVGAQAEPDLGRTTCSSAFLSLCQRESVFDNSFRVESPFYLHLNPSKDVSQRLKVMGGTNRGSETMLGHASESGALSCPQMKRWEERRRFGGSRSGDHPATA